jgi:predicted Zn-dependent protease
MDVHRFYISPYVPSSGFLDTLRNVAKFFTATEVKTAVDLLRQDERVQITLSGAKAIKPNSKTYDQEKLVDVTRERVLREGFGAAASTMPLMVITDRPITPPKDWRYIIWDIWLEPQRSAVISTVPLDPAYWEIPDPRRVVTIKNRTRTAAMSVCGTFLGLERCDNPRCFLYTDVGSVTNLDHMVRLGSEHDSEIGGLSGHGFQLPDGDPDIIQRIVQVPSGRSGGLR